MVTLDEFVETHLEKTYLWMQDKTLRSSFLLKKIITRENHKLWFNSIKEDSSQFIKAINFNGLHCGNCGLKNIDKQNRKAELWIYIGDNNFHGKGIAQEAVLKLVKLAINELLIHKIYLHVADSNERAIHLYKKCGFKEEGFLVDEIYYKNSFVSLYRMSFIDNSMIWKNY